MKFGESDPDFDEINEVYKKCMAEKEEFIKEAKKPLKEQKMPEQTAVKVKSKDEEDLPLDIGELAESAMLQGLPMSFGRTMKDKQRIK